MNILYKTYDWFTGGLCALLPQRIRWILGWGQEYQVIIISDAGLEIQCFKEQAEEPFRIIHSEQKTQDRQTLDILTQSSQKRSPIRLLLAPSACLLRRVFYFPDATLKNLHESLGFEISRKTPFTSEQVSYGYRILEHAAAKLHIELYIIPLKQLYPLLQQLREQQLYCNGVIPDMYSRTALDIDLMPEEEKASPPVSINYFAIALSALVVVLLFLCLYVPMRQQQNYISGLEQQIQSKQEIVKRLDELQTSLLEEERQYSFFNQLIKEQISAIDILQELSLLLPDDTWLEEFEIYNNQIFLDGRSGNAGRLIQILEDSAWFEQVEFINALTKDSRSSTERFSLTANLDMQP